ncbi:DUF1542 domain-containing protein, partial [Leuconostoc mesenteroides]|uniref:DUF1542 domain-containing protein n=1 Tax=Leuconostoc mesenteroides TaxID=1245 RepID=UPI001B8BB9DE
QTQAVADAATKAKNNIDQATTADGVNDAQATGITDIDNQHVPGAAVDDQKQAAKDAIDKEAAKVTEDIKNDPTLSQADKDKQTQAVADAATKAKNNIDQATNNDQITSAENAGITDIDNQHVPGAAVDDQKQTAKDAIDKEAAKVTEDIKNDPTLSQADKDKQTQAVADAATKAKNNIDQATTADGVNDAQATGITDIDNQHVPGAAVDDQKQTAKDAIDKEAAKVTEDIKNDPTLSQADKDKQTQAVADAATKAKESIDQATNNDQITSAENAGITDIDNQHVPGAAVDDQKQTAKDAIDKESAKVTEDIKNDPTLSQADKDKQTQAVADAATKAKNNIDQATTISELPHTNVGSQLSQNKINAILIALIIGLISLVKIKKNKY